MSNKLKNVLACVGSALLILFVGLLFNGWFSWLSPIYWHIIWFVSVILLLVLCVLVVHSLCSALWEVSKYLGILVTPALVLAVVVLYLHVFFVLLEIIQLLSSLCISDVLQWLSF